MPEIEFSECPHCGGYGVRDNGDNCITCGGSGTGGLHSTNGCIGSGELMYEKSTGRLISAKELADLMKEKAK
jgi:hypothetical protein